MACQQFQAKGCRSVEFGLFCATQPSITACSGIRIACWAGAYPGLTEHFAAANLDPNSNHWSKVGAPAPVLHSAWRIYRPFVLWRCCSCHRRRCCCWCCWFALLPSHDPTSTARPLLLSLPGV